MTTTHPQAFLHPATAAIPAALGTRARVNRLLSDGTPITQPVDPQS